MRLHFIGIGGIGVSALAQYYLATGHKVSGSDLASSEITEALKKLGAKIFIGKHNPKNLTKSVGAEKVKFLNLNLKVIYSPAVQEDNLELKEARRLGIKCQSYPEALGELTKEYFTIAVCGSHGKSTVASMLGILLEKAGFDPTVIIGTKLKEFGDSNFRMGGFSKSLILNLKSEILVIEADEHFASFLNYWPKIIVLTNLEPDHLDYYKNFKNYISGFKKFISHLPKDGILVANGDDSNIRRMLNPKSKIQMSNQAQNPKSKILDFSLKQKEVEGLRKILRMPGEHSIYNGLAALTVARALKIPDKISFHALSEFKGSWRRFEIKKAIINNKKLTIINDYGHHPTQIRATLKGAREKFKKAKIFCVFQPHQYQRTYYLFDDFVRALKEAPVDRLIITDIYGVAGREKLEIKKKVSAEKLVEAVKKTSVIYLPKDKIFDYLKKDLKGREVVIIMGAGDIYNLSLKFKNA